MSFVRQYHPADLFDDADKLVGQTWTCVRTRPRWEKKFAQWLRGHNMPFFLPLIEQRKSYRRKVCKTELPLFPGYVFTLGRHSKMTFTSSGSVVRLLHPQGDGEAAQLSTEILLVYRLLASGEHPALVTKWEPGQRVEVLAGPLAGATGQYIREGDNGRLVVWIDLLGVGATVALPPDTPLKADS